MDTISLQEILEYLAPGMDFEVREYSGRFMYGRRCLAITAQDLDIFDLGRRVQEYLMERELALEKEPGEISSDSMGLGSVWYWTSLEYYIPGTEEEE